MKSSKTVAATKTSNATTTVASPATTTNATSVTNHSLIRNLPVATFSYKGSHSKPVQRKVLITEISDDLITGLEVQEGRNRRDFESAMVKSYSREKMRDLTRTSLKNFQN